ncbi:MAG: NifB/NifX family molybdenum-iron cluster-binding protein [Elusimicrobia bacterium]|nr:NifB/NifX family molybdenum-iron cluster-binding protein [Elusimicrobiota bacterium]
MRIAVPVENDQLCSHFGHCQTFALFDVDKKEIIGRVDIPPPPHEPGLLPRWLGEKGVQVVIAGGIGGRARALFAERKIEVVVGAPSVSPETAVRQYVEGTLKTTANACTHEEGTTCGG